MTGKKKLMAGLGLAVVLLGGLTVLLMTEDKENRNQPDETAEGQVKVLTGPDTAQVQEIEIHNQNGTYHITKNEQEGFQIPELSDYAQVSSRMENAVGSLASISGEVVYDSGYDPGQFGLEDPGAEVVIRSAGEETTLYLGSYNEGASIWYVSRKGDESLYSIAGEKGDWLQRSGFYYLDPILISDFDQKNDVMTERLRTIRIERPDLEEALEIVADQEPAEAYTSSYMLTSPIRVKTSLKVMNTEIGNLFGFSADEVIGLYREEDQAAYGMDQPAMVMTVGHDGIQEVFTIGDEAPEGGRYLITSENELLYRISEEKLSFLHVTADDLFFEMALLPDIDEVAYVVLELEERSCRFDLNHTAEGENSQLAVTMDGTVIDQKLFCAFYSFLLEVDIEKINTDAPVGERVLNLVYHYTDDTEDQVEAFAMEGSRRMTISVNGEPQFEGRTAYLEKLKVELQHLLDGEAIDTNW